MCWSTKYPYPLVGFLFSFILYLLHVGFWNLPSPPNFQLPSLGWVWIFPGIAQIICICVDLQPENTVTVVIILEWMTTGFDCIERKFATNHHKDTWFEPEVISKRYVDNNLFYIHSFLPTALYKICAIYRLHIYMTFTLVYTLFVFNMKFEKVTKSLVWV